MSWLQKVTENKNKQKRLYGIAQKGDGRQTIHYYVNITPEKEQAFLSAMNDNVPFKLSEYGDVVYASEKKPSLRQVLEMERGA
jgi:hypothetical protein